MTKRKGLEEAGKDIKNGDVVCTFDNGKIVMIKHQTIKENSDIERNVKENWEIRAYRIVEKD